VLLDKSRKCPIRHRCSEGGRQLAVLGMTVDQRVRYPGRKRRPHSEIKRTHFSKSIRTAAIPRGVQLSAKTLSLNTYPEHRTSPYRHASAGLSLSPCFSVPSLHTPSAGSIHPSPPLTQRAASFLDRTYPRSRHFLPMIPPLPLPIAPPHKQPLRFAFGALWPMQGRVECGNGKCVDGAGMKGEGEGVAEARRAWGL